MFEVQWAIRVQHFTCFLSGEPEARPPTDLNFLVRKMTLRLKRVFLKLRSINWETRKPKMQTCTANSQLHNTIALWTSYFASSSPSAAATDQLHTGRHNWQDFHCQWKWDPLLPKISPVSLQAGSYGEIRFVFPFFFKDEAIKCRKRLLQTAWHNAINDIGWRTLYDKNFNDDIGSTKNVYVASSEVYK